MGGLLGVVMSPKLTPEHLISAIPKLHGVEALLSTLKGSLGREPWPSLTALLALYLVHDLYDPASSDRANLRRIRYNLDAAAHELQAVSERLKTLADQHGIP